MIRIPAGKIQLWPDFTLHVPHEITLLEGGIYHLSGRNGSGKSSLMRKFLLEYQSDTPVYRIYVEQQMNTQLYALRAMAAFDKTRQRITCEEDAVEYLLNDLQQCLAMEPRPVWVFVDESRFLPRIITYPAITRGSSLLVYCSHDAVISGSEELVCSPVDKANSELRYVHH